MLFAFLDALTVTAVLITVFIALYGVYEKEHSSIGLDYNENEKFDRKEMGSDSLEKFRSFLRSLVMHGAVVTALSGVATLVGEPQNLLIVEKKGWDFMTFAAEVTHVSFPAFIAGLCVVVAVELTGTFSFGAKLEPHVIDILKGYIETEMPNVRKKTTMHSSFRVYVQYY